VDAVCQGVANNLPAFSDPFAGSTGQHPAKPSLVKRCTAEYIPALRPLGHARGLIETVCATPLVVYVASRATVHI
jgi:hypothetical protein